MLDREGRIFHDGALVENQRLMQAMHTWIRRHPDNGRTILSNGYDWSYLTVEDVPYFVQSIQCKEPEVTLCLSDGSREVWKPQDSYVGESGALYTRVKRDDPHWPGPPVTAKFTRHAQNSLAPILEEEGGHIFVHIGQSRIALEKQ